VPSIAAKASVLEGRAEVVSYTRDASAFFLRVRIKEKAGYKSRRIDGVESLDAAIDAALDAYMKLGSAEEPSKPRRGTKEGTKIVNTKRGVFSWLDQFLDNEHELCEAGIIKGTTLKGKIEMVRTHLKPYLISQGVTKTSQIKVGVFDKYESWRIERNKKEGSGPPSKLTLRKESALIGNFVGYLVKNRCIDAYEAAQKKDIAPKIRLSDSDFDSNPPIRDDDEWRLILGEIRKWVKEGASHARPRTLVYRQMFWTLMLVLKQTGMRPDEARNLRWKDIETEDIGRFSKTQWEKDMVHFQDQEIDPYDFFDKGEVDAMELGRVSRYVTHIKITQSKTKSLREVTSNSAETLARWKKWQKDYLNQMQSREEFRGYEYEVAENDLVFGIPEHNGVQITTYNTLNVNWRNIIKRCGDRLKGPLVSDHNYTIYSLRATRAQELMDMGVDVYLAATQLGHTVAILEKVYARLPQRRRATTEAAHIEFGKRKDNNQIVEIEEVIRRG
jgi:integrase